MNVIMGRKLGIILVSLKHPVCKDIFTDRYPYKNQEVLKMIGCPVREEAIRLGLNYDPLSPTKLIGVSPHITFSRNTVGFKISHLDLEEVVPGEIIPRVQPIWTEYIGLTSRQEVFSGWQNVAWDAPAEGEI